MILLITADTQRTEYQKFKAVWHASVTDEVTASILVGQSISYCAARIGQKNKMKTYEMPLSDLPFGATFEKDDSAYMRWYNGPLVWSANGYQTPPSKVTDSVLVKVLTLQ